MSAYGGEWPRADGAEPDTRAPGLYGGGPIDTTALIVDDDARNIIALTALLERAGISVAAVTSGPQALTTLTERADVGIVLMDIMMPEMDGYQTMLAIRKLPELADLPIIAVTGKDADGERERCLNAGASDYVAKPVSPRLLDLIGAWMSPHDPARTDAVAAYHRHDDD
jgi:CheY-like chemotaxis protein